MADRRVSVQVDADVSPFIRGLTTASATAKGFARELESADSRMAALVQTGLALAPALVPLGAAAVPAIAGLTTQLGFAVGAAGTAVLAFQGVGDALKALNDFELAPTSEHFAKLRETMDALGPAGQEFVLAMQDLRPELQRLQDTAQQGLLPGVTEGIDELMDLMPKANKVIGTFSSTLGNLVAEAGDNLNDARWRDFFDWLNRQATPTLSAMGKTLGNFVEGLSNMVVAFTPLSDDFTTGLLNMSRAFNEWTQGLGDSEGFQDFVDYVRESGPQAMDTLGALASALVSLVKAAAPVGQAVLPVIEALANGLAAIANSPAGPVLITAAAAIGTLGRSMALLKSVGLMGGDSLISRVLGTKALGDARSAATSLKVAQAELKQAAITARDAQFALIPTPQKRAALNQYAEAQRKVAAAEQERSAALRGSMASVGKAAAVVGGLALAQSGLAEKTGLSNTMSLALMGTLAGPWGAAVGAGAGLAMDLAAANNDVEDAMRRAAAAASSMAVDFTAQHAALTTLQTTTEDYAQSVHNAGMLGRSSFGDLWKAASDFFTNTSKESRDAANSQTQDFMALRQGAAEFYAALNDGDLSMLHATDEQLTRFVTQIAPALQKAGLDIRDVLLTRNGWDAAVEAVSAYNASMDSASGKSKVVGEALRELGSEIESNVTQADALKNAMDSLFGVELSQSAATDQWIGQLRELRKQIADTNGTLKGGSEAALANREAVRSSVKALQDKVAADAAAGKSGDKLVRTLQDGRQAIIDQATAAGAKKGEIKSYLDTLGLTPKNLRTIIETPGLLTAKQQVQALGKLYGLTPKQVSTLLKQPGMGKSQSDIKALMRQYDLTPKQVQTLIKLLGADSAIGKVSQLRGIYAGLPRQVVTSIITNHVDKFVRQTGFNEADGGVVDYFANGAENHVAQIAPAGAWRVWAEPETGGEAYIPLAASKRDRSVDIWRAVGDRLGVQFQEFANGGITSFADGGIARPDRSEIIGLLQQIRDLRKDLAKDGKDALHGLDRRKAQADLAETLRDLAAKRAEPRQARRDALETKLSALQSSLQAFDVTSVLPGDHSPRNPVTAGVRAEIREFRDSIKEAGGEWTKAMQRQSERMLKNAHAIDVHERALARETARRDKLTETLSQQQQAMEQLQSTMTAFSESVAGNFTGSPFGQSRTETIPGSVDPALAARLSGAEARLAALRSSPGGDSLAAAAEASRLLPQIEAMRAEVERQSQPVERTVSGLEAMREQLQQNTADALAFADALKTLQAKGLNGDLFAQLAASGDLTTAQQLAAGGMSAVEDINALWNDRAAAAAEVAAFATQTVYGQQQAILQTQIDAQSKLIAKSEHTISRLNDQVKTLGDRVEHGAERGVAGLQTQMSRIESAIANLPRQTTEAKRKG